MACSAGTRGDTAGAANGATVGGPDTGPGTGQGQVVIRTLRPDATGVTALFDGQRVPMAQIHPGGVFAGLAPGPVSDYRVEVTYGSWTHVTDDPYRWLPTL